MESLVPSKRHHQKPRIGSKYQVDVPSFKSSCRIKSQEHTTRDQFYACGLAVPVTRIAVDSQSASRKRKLSTDQASCSNASTVNSRSPDTQENNINNAADIDLNRAGDNGSKDAYSCASSSKEKFVTWNQDCATTEDGCQGVGEEEEQTVDILPKKRKKKRSCKRSCWQPKRRVSKKPRLEIYSAHCVEEEDEEEHSDFKRKIVPGARPESWSQAEAAYFRLAIFILGKRFCEISKFMGTKKVIDVSDYYYSKFFGRPVWARWKASKSLKCKISVRGELILVGWRQMELLRRIKLVVSDDAYREIMKATSAFNVHLPEPHHLSDESKVAEYLRRKREKLETYVFTLKDIVGLELLEKCVGVGGPRDGHMSKRDLTSGPYPPQYSLLPRQLKEKHTRFAGKSQHTSFVPAGSENFWPPRSEDSLQSTLSVGENWLRKRTSNSDEIAQHFWERVWPTLERGGWKTIERKMSIKSSPKLLFLRPGVDKLHREERGISYFDNLNGVIEAVKDDPSLRQLADDPRDESDAPDDEEAAQGGWSDDEDMFTTLDGKRTIVPPTIPSTRARTAEDSSQSSSLDLNREMSAVNSKPQVESASKNETSLETIRETTHSSCEKSSGFPLGGIDLNLLPADYECIADACPGTADLERLECEFLHCSSIRRDPEPEPVSILVDGAHPETELTLSLGNFTNHVYGPYPSPSTLDCVHEASVQPESAEAATSTSQLTTRFESAGHTFSHHIEVPSRKRSLGYQRCDGQGDWFDNGKELVSFPKKRAITLDWIPRGLGELPVTTFLIRMNKAAFAQFYPGISSCVGAMPDEWWLPTNIIDMKLPVQGLPKSTQNSATQLLSSARRLRGRSPVEEPLKPWHNNALYGWSRGARSPNMTGFREPRCKVVEVCTAPEDAISIDEHDSVALSEFAVCKGVDEPRTIVSSQEPPQKAVNQPASYLFDSPDLLLGFSQGAFQDIRGVSPQVTSSLRRRSSPIACFQEPTWKAVEANTNSSDEQERVPVPHEGQHEEAPTSEFKTIRFHVKDRVHGPIVSKERSKRVPRNYSSGINLPKSKAWLRRDHGDFPSVSESFNSCLTTDSVPVHGRDEEEPLQTPQLRVKSEDTDIMESPSCSLRSWGTADQDEEFLSGDHGDHGDEKPFRAECRTSGEMFSASAACGFYDSSLYRPRKRRCDASLWPRKGSPDCYLVDSVKRLSTGQFRISDPYSEIADKRIKGSHEDPVLKSSSPVQDMFRDSYEVLRGEAKEDHWIECASTKTKDKRSKPRRQIRNVSCERFLIMLYTESVEEELPVESRSSQGPFQAPSHLPHLRGARPNKVRRRRSSLPCRNKKVGVQSTDLRASAGASPKRSVGSPVVPVDEEVTSAASIVKWPQQDGRFTLRRTLSDFSAKTGRQCTKRGGGRWQHCCSGC